MDSHKPKNKSPRPCIAIACGGSGGHLFPGVALAEEFADFNIQTELFITSKKVDDAGVSTLKDIEIHKLPGRPFSLKGLIGFLKGFWNSYRESLRLLRASKPLAMVATGSFACLGPVLAARKTGAKIYLHEANSIPGKAVRLLANKVDRVYHFFPGIERRLPNASCKHVGMPVRRQFEPFDPVACRLQLGLQAHQPTLLVMGGSQGARPINKFLTSNILEIQRAIPNLQILHITGPLDYEEGLALQKRKDVTLRIITKPFLTEMEFAYGASNLALCRSGASTIAELAAMKVPSILIPYPHSADGHQKLNAQLVHKSGAAFMVSQNDLEAETVIPIMKRLFFDQPFRSKTIDHLKDWFHQDSTGEMAEDIISHLGIPGKRRSPEFTFIKKKLTEA